MFRYSALRRAYWACRGYPAQRVLDLLLQSQWWPQSRLEQLRNDKFRAMVRHCYDHVPYYRDVMKARGLTPEDFKQIEDLPKLPLLTKEIVRKNAQRLQADNIPDSQTYPATTGGTTGEPMRVRRWVPDVAWQTQCYVRGLSWGGLWPNMPRISLFGGSLGQADPAHFLQRCIEKLKPQDVFLPAFELSRSNLDHYLARMRASGARHLVAYASAIYMLATLAEERGISYPLQAVFPTAEVLPDAWREKIARVFSCKVLSYYGCGEVNSLGYQCGEADGFHRCDEHAVMEIALPQGGASFEGRGAFLITDLDNHAMPILRYANGDAGVLAAQPCPCGRIGGRILSLQGRVNDLLVTEDGACISGAIAPHALRLSRGVILYQFVQDRPGQVLVRIVRSAEYDRSSEEMRLRDILAKHLGASSEITFEYPDDIERSPAGKIRFVINRYLQTAPQGARTTGTGSGTQG